MDAGISTQPHKCCSFYRAASPLSFKAHTAHFISIAAAHVASPEGYNQRVGEVCGNNILELELLWYIHTAPDWEWNRWVLIFIIYNIITKYYIISIIIYCYSHWFEAGTGSRSHCFLLCQFHSLYHPRSRSRAV